MINPTTELFRWGPIDARPIYPDYWYKGIIECGKRFVRWPEFFMHISKEKVLYVCEQQLLRDQGQECFERFILDDKQFEAAYAEWNTILDGFVEFLKTVEQKIKTTPDKELMKLLHEFNERYTQFWIIGLVPELAAFGGEQLLKKELHKKITHGMNFALAVQTLSAPEELSFYQVEELELLKLKGQEKLLPDHQQNYFWLLNSYHHTQMLPVSHFKERLASVSSAEAKEKMRKITGSKEEILKSKADIIRRLKLGEHITKIASRLAFCIWWQDLRKKHIFIANHYIDVFLMEIARRCRIDFDDLHYYCVPEVEDLLLGKKVPENILTQRKADFLKHYSDESNSAELVIGSAARKIIAPFYAEVVDPHQKIKGEVVSRGHGNVRGAVRVIHSAMELHKMKKGDILVTSMTSPDFIVGMRKAGAVVTDEGGITSHAAVVSRELGVLCVIGTKVATKLLKDGEMVEVHGNGTVSRV